MTELINVFDWERESLSRLAPDVAGYLAGGAGDERALAGNREAFARLRLVPRMLAGVAAPELATTVLGTPVSMPVLAAPIGHQVLFHPEGELASARAAAGAGTLYCLSTMANRSLEEVAAAIPEAPRWFQLYARRDRGLRRDLVDRAVSAGYGAIVVTADVVSLGRRERDRRSGFALPADLPVPNLLAARDGALTLHQTTDLLEPALTWEDVAEIASWAGLPVLVKGVLHPDDAVLAAEHGCAGVVVSNHGGRQLDGAIAPIDALPRIADAAGDRLELLLDGGVRRGEDVVAALALGARAVLLGRPLMHGLVCGGTEGVAAILELMRLELANALHLCGIASVGAVPRGVVRLAG